MCGILGLLDLNQPVATDLYRGGLALQHRGQDGAGLITFDERFHRHTGLGLLNEIFRFQNLEKFPGSLGLVQLRYATAGEGSVEEVQPFTLTFPQGLALVHNGNLTNDPALRKLLGQRGYRRVNSLSDSETLLHVFADALTRNRALELTGLPVPIQRSSDNEDLFEAARMTMMTCQGAYSVVMLVADRGLLAFRDPHGIRPLCLGTAPGRFAFASESVALDVIGLELERDLQPGEAVFVDMEGKLHCRQLINPKPAHCVFEYIYLARPESVVDGHSVSEVRERLGQCLAKRCTRRQEIDVVLDVPSSAEDAAITFASASDLPYRKGIRKNPYSQRSFIAANQALRAGMVGTKFLFEKRVITGKRLAVIDDSIVRGTTARRLVESLRKQGAYQVFFFSASPPVRYPCVYGIDMAVSSQLAASQRTAEQMAQDIGVEHLQYQSQADMESCLPGLPLCTACFSGEYPTDVNEEELAHIGEARAKVSV
ncbi:amidophosphoribosyltransferase [bacterium SCN 62-11]|nr:amidophosphoribosyltransferase [Candidatus Eremiobacteraeota bacterium]ODT77929.1 MAG: amidophosphoribosyltransferase [bacterium SCN 62-11]